MATEKPADDNGKRRVLDWIGYKKDEVAETPMTPEMMLSTIQKLQDEVAALRAQKNFHELDPSELEALASETAVTILATVHKREAEAKKAAAATISSAEKKADQILAAAEKSATELIASAEKKIKDAEKQATQTISVAETTASTALKNVTAESKQIIADGQAEAAKIIREATNHAESAKREAEAYATKVRREADTYAAKTTKDVNEQAAAIRREVIDALSVAKANHLAAVDTQEKARQASEKVYNTIINSIESFEDQPQKSTASAKPNSAK